MKAVVLAAGKGSRLYPVTHHIPKPLLPLANRITLEFAFDRLKEIGVTDICLVVGENESKMKAALKDGSQFGVKLHYVRQHEPKGLAHALGFAAEWVNKDPFVLYLGDAIYTTTLVPYANRFVETGCSNLNLVQPVEDPRRYGVANTDGERIVRLVEKPEHPESNLAMAGTYFFGSEIWSILPDLKPSARGEYEITDAIQMLIDRGHTVLAGIYHGHWFDSGTLDSYLEVSAYLSEGKILNAGTVEGQVDSPVVIGAGATVICDSIEDSVILPGAKVHVLGRIRHALLGGHVKSDDDISNEIVYDHDRT